MAIPLRDLCAGRVNSVLGPHMDSGRVIIIIPADGMALDAVCAIANKLDFALRLEDLGHIVSCSELTFEPFTPESSQFGRKGHQITLTLDTPLEFRRASNLFLAAGALFSSHITYTDQMRMCGGPLSRI